MAGPETGSGDRAAAIGAIIAVAAAHLLGEIAVVLAATNGVVVDRLSVEIVVVLAATNVVVVDRLSVEIVVVLAAITVVVVSHLSEATVGPAALETMNVRRGWRECCGGSTPTETALSSRERCRRKENGCSPTWPSERASKSTAQSASRRSVMPCSAAPPPAGTRRSRARSLSLWFPGSGQIRNCLACRGSANESNHRPVADPPGGRRTVGLDHLRPEAHPHSRLRRVPDRIGNGKNECEDLPGVW